MVRHIADLKNNQSGAVAIIVALSMLTLIGILLLTINLTNHQNSDINTKGAADSAVLTTAQYITQQSVLNGQMANGTITSGPVYQAAVQAFQANSSNSEKLTTFQVGSVTVKIEPQTLDPTSQQVRVCGCHVVANNFALGSVGSSYNCSGQAVSPANNTTLVCNESVANIGKLSGELVFAVDVSGSMKDPVAGLGGTKIDLLNQAVNQVVTNQLTNNNALSTGIIPGLYWGFVPYRGVVDLGNYSGFVTNDFSGFSGNMANEDAFLDNNSNPTGSATLNNANVSAELQRVPVELASPDDFTDAPPLAMQGQVSANSTLPARQIYGYWYQPQDYWFYMDGEAACNGVENCSTWPATTIIKTDKIITAVSLCQGEYKLYSLVDEHSCHKVHKEEKCTDTEVCEASNFVPNSSINCNCGAGYQPPVRHCIPVGNGSSSSSGSSSGGSPASPPPPPGGAGGAAGGPG